MIYVKVGSLTLEQTLNQLYIKLESISFPDVFPVRNDDELSGEVGFKAWRKCKEMHRLGNVLDAANTLYLRHAL
jgi:hypothetical protein